MVQYLEGAKRVYLLIMLGVALPQDCLFPPVYSAFNLKFITHIAALCAD